MPLLIEMTFLLRIIILKAAPLFKCVFHKRFFTLVKTVPRSPLVIIRTECLARARSSDPIIPCWDGMG